MNPGKALFEVEAPEIRKKRANRIYKILDDKYEFEYGSWYGDPYKVIVGTILSAQTTDINVEKVLPTLFKKYPNPKKLAGAELPELEQIVFQTGYYKNKARLLKGMAKMVVEEFGGKVPQTMPELLKLPGVGRKTANIVLQAAFGKIEGVVVDTHVFRVSRLLGLSAGKTPGKVEEDLQELFVKSKWENVTAILIEHGREICIANRPKCWGCPIANFCPSAYMAGLGK
jgi:endonuclease-3